MNYTYKYAHPAVTVDNLIIADDKETKKILLIKRKNDPDKGKWAFPGGFVDENEDLVDAAKRELEEETGLTNIDLTQFRAFGKAGRDPRGWCISVCFYGFVTLNEINVKANDDAEMAEWFDIDDLPELAFDHKEILELATIEIFSTLC